MNAMSVFALATPCHQSSAHAAPASETTTGPPSDTIVVPIAALLHPLQQDAANLGLCPPYFTSSSSCSSTTSTCATAHGSSAANPQLARPPPAASPGASASAAAQLMRCSVRLAGMPECRICLSPGDAEPLIQPCGCAGSVGNVHPACLAAWVAESGSLVCELCKQLYRQPHVQALEPVAKSATERTQQTHATATGLQLALQHRSGLSELDWLCCLLALVLLIVAFIVISITMSRREASSPACQSPC